MLRPSTEMAREGPRPSVFVLWEAPYAAPLSGQNWRLTRRLSGVTAQLIDLAGSRLHMEDRIVFDGLLDGRADDPGMRGADRIDTPFS